MIRQALSTATLASVGLLSKGFLRFGCANVNVQGLDVLMSALEDENRRGIITVANHTSLLDDPLVWGILPTYTYFDPRSTRWTLGASDIMFTNPLLSAFFRAGQVIETMRGAGINQLAVTQAISKLDEGAWVHVFPEGKVNQPSTNPAGGLFPFKWGIGRMIMETKSPPYIIPMWMAGFDKVMPEPRAFVNRFPRPGQRLSVTFERDPKLNDAIGELRAAWTAKGRPDSESAPTRSAITKLLRNSIQGLGERFAFEG